MDMFLWIKVLKSALMVNAYHRFVQTNLWPEMEINLRAVCKILAFATTYKYHINVHMVYRMLVLDSCIFAVFKVTVIVACCAIN